MLVQSLAIQANINDETCLLQIDKNIISNVVIGGYVYYINLYKYLDGRTGTPTRVKTLKNAWRITS